MPRIVGLILAALALAASAQEKGPIYLRCTPDSDLPANDYILDPRAQTISSPLPGIGPFPMKDDETFYFTRTESNGTVLLDLRFNKFTLRYRLFIAWPEQMTIAGQCQVIEKKI